MKKTPDTPDAATPENTPVPGGGSWAWCYSQRSWVAQGAAVPVPPGQPEQLDPTPLQAGIAEALQINPSNQE